jgi:hypothetical protein
MAVDHTLLEAPVALMLEQEVPVRMTWNGEWFYVVGTPQPLEERDDVTAWRFAATTTDGETHTFDVISPGYARWNLDAVRP